MIDDIRHHRMAKGGICKDCFKVGPVDTICNYCSLKENGFKQNTCTSHRTSDEEINPLQLSLAAETDLDVPKSWESEQWYFNFIEDQRRDVNVKARWTETLKKRAKKMISCVADQYKHVNHVNKRQKTDGSVDEEEEGTDNVAKKPAAK